MVKRKLRMSLGRLREVLIGPNEVFRCFFEARLLKKKTAVPARTPRH